MKLSVLCSVLPWTENNSKTKSITNNLGLWDNYFTFSISGFLTSHPYFYPIGFTPLKLDHKGENFPPEFKIVFETHVRINMRLEALFFSINNRCFKY